MLYGEKLKDFSDVTVVNIYRMFKAFGFEEVFGRSAIMGILDMKTSAIPDFHPICRLQKLSSPYQVMEKEDIVLEMSSINKPSLKLTAPHLQFIIQRNRTHHATDIFMRNPVGLFIFIADVIERKHT